jgi:hypothetical protein
MEEDEYLLYSDVDVMFFNPIGDLLKEEMGDNDIVFLDNDNALCTGFIFMRNSNRVRKFWEGVVSGYTLKHGDNINTKIFIRDHEIDIKYKLFSSKFFNISMMKYLCQNKYLSNITKDFRYGNGLRSSKQKKSSFVRTYIRLFIEEMKIFSDPIVMFHFNCIIGIDEKEKWLKIVSKELGV